MTASPEDTPYEHRSGESADGSDLPPTDPTIADVLSELETLKETVDDKHERDLVHQTIALVEELPGSKALRSQVKKYTTRDMAEAFVGGILFSLPLLVEDGVFEIANWFVDYSIASIPMFLVINIAFVIGITTGLLYYTDFRNVKVYRPIFGLIPRRLIGILSISLIVACGMMFMWGRLAAENPTALESTARVTVIWAAAAFGAALGDILPGESTGTDINELFN